MIGNREEVLRQQPDGSFDGGLGGMGHSLEVLFTFASLQSNLINWILQATQQEGYLRG